MAKLTKPEQTGFKPFIHDIFTAAGIVKKDVRTSGINTIIVYDLVEEAKVICNEIKLRKFDFTAVDDALKRIAQRQYASGFTVYALHTNEKVRLNQKQLADVLAAFCAEREIFWDDVNTSRTTTEMDVYRSTVFGGACWAFGCFLSQHLGKTAKSGGSSPKTAPASSYKSSGPKSSMAKGLVGEPGEKTMLPAGGVVYLIECISTKPKKQCIFIDPLKSNQLRFGDPSGWSTCKILFSSLADAEAALEKIKAGSYSIPSHITELRIAKQKVDPNGYFIISTDVGNVYINASKLNEAITEASSKKARPRTSSYGIKNIDVYHEAMIHLA
jgi:hypothetical protein